MDIYNCSTSLFVRDIEVSKKFYVRILKIPVKLDFGKNVILQNGLTLWEINRFHIIPEKLGVQRVSDDTVNRFELYFESDNLESVFKILKEQGVVFLHEIHEESWGQQTTRFFDPDNHLIEVGESMKLFVGRLFKQGLTVEQVSAKTHIPIEEIKKLVS